MDGVAGSFIVYRVRIMPIAGDGATTRVAHAQTEFALQHFFHARRTSIALKLTLQSVEIMYAPLVQGQQPVLIYHQKLLYAA